MDTTLISIFQLVVLVFSVVAHEVAHGAVAESLGDDTARRMGRLTLNPLKHIDPFGSVFLPLLLVLIHSPFLFGYAKPVPYDPRNLRDQRFGPAKVAAAGPVTNLILALLAGVSVRVLIGLGASTTIIELMSYVVLINLILAFFNLAPIPPLDGHWVLMTFVPVRFLGVLQVLYRNSLIFLGLFIIFVFPLLLPLIAWIFRLLTGITIGA